MHKYLREQSGHDRWNEEAVRQEQALQPVLSRCLEMCEDFKVLMDNLLKNSKDGMKVWDRARVALKKKDIEAFRENIGSTRQGIGIAVSSLNL